MRLSTRNVGLPLLWMALASGSTPSIGADPESALATLKGLGLAKSGHTFVIEPEKPALAKIKEAKAAISSYGALLDRQATIEQVSTQLVQLEQQRVELQEQVTNLNQQIVEQGATQGNMGRGGQNNFQQRGGMATQMIAQRNQMKLSLAEVKQEQQALKANTPQVKEKSAMEEDVKAKGEALKATLADIRPMIDEVKKQYADLEANKSVKAAIAELERASKASLNIGPSEAFLAGVKTIDQAEQRLSGKKATTVSRKKAKSRK